MECYWYGGQGIISGSVQFLSVLVLDKEPTLIQFYRTAGYYSSHYLQVQIMF